MCEKADFHMVCLKRQAAVHMARPSTHPDFCLVTYHMLGCAAENEAAVNKSDAERMVDAAAHGELDTIQALDKQRVPLNSVNKVRFGIKV